MYRNYFLVRRVEKSEGRRSLKNMVPAFLLSWFCRNRRVDPSLLPYQCTLLEIGDLSPPLLPYQCTTRERRRISFPAPVLCTTWDNRRRLSFPAPVSWCTGDRCYAPNPCSCISDILEIEVSPSLLLYQSTTGDKSLSFPAPVSWYCWR